ncbi:MAG TPA: hypothetical protein VGK67_24615 [Myxococcales bacterium]
MIRSTWWLVGVLVLALTSCGSSTARPADVDAEQPDAAAGAEDAASPPAADAQSSSGPDASPASPDAGAAGPPDAAAPPCTPASADAGTSRSGYPLDGWTWTRHGVLFEPPAEVNGDLAPSLVSDGTALHLFFTRKQGTTHRIHHAVSRDGGATWAVGATAATGLGEDGVVAYPAALFEGGKFRLWYGSGTFDLAESADGDAWTIVQAAALRPGDTGAFDDWSLLYPAVTHDAAGYQMLYTGYDGAGFAIGRADSADGKVFARVGNGPVLAKGSAADVDNHAVAQSAVVRAGQTWLVWYGAYDTSKSNPGPYRVSLATSTDGLAFTKRGLTLELSEAGTEAWSTRDPAVLRTAEGWLMVYSGMGDDGRYRLFRATSTTCAPADP